MKRFVLILALAGAAAFPIGAQPPPSNARAHVETLASERLEGRLAGSHGEQLASDYIAAELKRIGAKPLPGRSDFLLPFEFTAGTRDGGSTVGVSFTTQSPGGASAASVVDAHARALSFSDSGDASGPIVFAGYGIVVPDSQDFGYNSYAGLDVKDKIVLVLRYFPEDADQKTRAVLARYSDLRYKAMAARQRGAKAMVVVTGPRSPNAGELVPMTFDSALAGSGIVAVSITGDVAQAMFRRADKTLEDAQKALDSGNPHVAGFPLPGIEARVHAAVEREKRTGHNVAAYLPATDGAPSEKPWVALGAHYDHLGRGDHGNSLATKDQVGQIHVGADDNASGTAAVLAVGEALAKQPRRRHVLLALWSGEELGLIGSSAFIASPPVPIDQVEAYLNFDMVGRMQDNKLTIQATGSSPAWAKIIEQANVAAGFDLLLQPDPYQPTDVESFNGAGVPCLSFFTGTHADYHKPTDTANKIDYADLDRIVDFAAAITRRLADLAQAPQFTKVDQPAQSGAGRAGVRVFTGTIPDYSTEVKGLLLGGVIGGGPAEQAGLQKGDVIVEIAGQTIANIYDYTYALEVLKIGQPAKVVYLRSGVRKETMLTPGARK
jgi:Zn-dependent M28 family amino/carboxypeptidase